VNRGLAGLLILIAIVGLGGCSSGAQMVAGQPGPLGAIATASATGATAGDLGTYPLGAVVPVGSPPAVTIQVVKYEQDPVCLDTSPATGDRLVGVSVEYLPSVRVRYALSDWTARADHASLSALSGCYRDIMAPGLASPGETVDGWVLLQVPTSSQHLWVMYAGAAGVTIEWQLY
jgi:hypothetical protein